LYPLVPRAELLPLATSPFSSLSLAPDVELRHAAAKPAASGRPSRLRAHLCSCASRRASVASGRPSRPRGACALGAHPRSCLAPSCRPLATQVAADPLSRRSSPRPPPGACPRSAAGAPRGATRLALSRAVCLAAPPAARTAVSVLGARAEKALQSRLGCAWASLQRCDPRMGGVPAPP
jgi:hypothetical protein